MNIAERNRAIKKVLGAVYGRDKVRVRGSRGTGYGWVTVHIDYTPLDNMHREKLSIEAKGKLREAGIDLGRSYTDDTCQSTCDRCHIAFHMSRYRQTVRHDDGMMSGLRWDDQWEQFRP